MCLSIAEEENKLVFKMKPSSPFVFFQKNCQSFTACLPDIVCTDLKESEIYSGFFKAQ